MQDRMEVRGEVRLEDIDGKSCRQVRYNSWNSIANVLLRFKTIFNTIFLSVINRYASFLQIMDISIEVSAWGFGSIFETLLASNLEKDTALIPGAVEAWVLFQKDPAAYKEKYAAIENKALAEVEKKAEPAAAPAPAPAAPQQASVMGYISSWWS